MKTLIYRGFITQYDSYGDGWESAISIPQNGGSGALINELEEHIYGEQVSVRYWISDVEQSKDDLIEDFVRKLYGDVHLNNESCYSEYTGYLWTNEDLSIGGHDLMSELWDNVGKFIHLEIDVH